jgi:hypothetical protein
MLAHHKAAAPHLILHISTCPCLLLCPRQLPSVVQLFPAAGVAGDISSFLSKAAALQEAHAASLAAGISSAEEGEDEQQQQQQHKKRRGANTSKHAARDGQLPQPFLPAAMLKELQASLSNAKQAGVTSQLDEEQLRQLLRMLLGHVQLGIELPLDEHDVVRMQ